MSSGPKKKLAVWKFASCDGCQLNVLNLEDELLLLADAIELAYFPEATSREIAGPYDVSLVEGSVTTPHDLGRIRKIRAQSRFLITIGACATAGGIQALRNFGDVREFAAIVYAKPEYIETLADSRPIAACVDVDYELRGCPINKHQLLELVSSFLAGKRPNIPDESVCMECKRQGNVCVIVNGGQACLGPVTHAGCGALCPRFRRGCYGCFGPRDSVAPSRPARQLGRRLETLGHDRGDLMRLYRNFNAAAPVFADASRRYEQEDD